MKSVLDEVALEINAKRQQLFHQRIIGESEHHVDLSHSIAEIKVVRLLPRLNR